MRMISIAGALLALLAWPSLAGAAEVHVKIDNFTFVPAEIVVAPGTTVIWDNEDDIPHSIVEDHAAFRSKVLDTGETFSRTFSQAGETLYFCGLHPHMRGKVIVRP